MRIFACVQYVHSLGILHCDIRPKSFLIDEYGILKVSDFKFSRRLPKSCLKDTPLELRGVAAYMAPELFTAEGIHSYATDFWALGCVLYELRRGIPPFGQDFGNPSFPSSDSMELQDLIERINTSEPVTSPVVFSENNNNNSNSSHINDKRNNRDSDRTRSVGSRASTSSSRHATTPSVTAELADLLLWLLEKSPIERCNW